MTRQTKTPRQRAEEQLATEQRRIERLTDQLDRALQTAEQANKEAERLSKERTAAIARRDYLAQHPDLQQTTNQTGDPA